MNDVSETEKWLKTIFNINKELDFEYENSRISLERIKELEAKKEEIFKIIMSIEKPEYKQILHKRYIQGKKWEEIEKELHYAGQHIHRLHKNAINEVHKKRTEQRN